MKQIKLTCGDVALVDDQDYDRLACLTWGKVRRGRNFYAANWPPLSGGKKKVVYLHQAVLGRVDMEIDHKDRNGLNCVRDNLRLATRQQNSMNRAAPSSNTSGFKGVSWHALRSRWRARIMVGGKENHLGLFDSALAAAREYNKAAQRLYGEHAFLNDVS